MRSDAITEGDQLHMQVGPDPQDYVLRCAPGDYDCYHQGRYIGSRSTPARAIAAIEAEQDKVARHPFYADATTRTIAAHQELQLLAGRVQALAERLASQPDKCARLTLAHIQLIAALRSLESAERTLALAQRQVEPSLDTAA
jgi:hypothetical protein